MILSSLCVAYAGLLALALALDRHHEQVFARRPSARTSRLLVWAGWLGLALSLPPAVMAWGWGIGIPAWLGLLTVAAAALVLLLPHAPRAALRLGPAALLCAPFPALLG
ncbi:DUF3325 domain-containing protein [Azospirillum argentinense]|uniref:DUF3325 domain-containing protein n=1 Tax=Azospirillum argentinense TaxID=2970906 RepID=A0A2K1FWI5_9PROT|nr:DUF3325 domain-containing protein [Azospirillum argentinense]PNQ96905.1 DUF3325 domain-containing protein [Azospirillum argentinense]